MEMHKFEKAIVNTPATTFLHGHVLLRDALAEARPVVGDALEIGCGQGATTKILLQQFPEARITAIDFEQAQVARARRRLGSRARIEQGDVTRLAYGDASFDTVFELNVLHHVRNPLAALGEIHRVLRPGGQLVFTDYTSKFFRGPVAKMFPPETLFSASQFLGMLQDAGFRVASFRGAYIVRGAATKPDDSDPSRGPRVP